MGFLTLENILQAQDLEAAEIEVPEWGGKVKARPLTAAEWEHITEKATVGPAFAKLLIASSLIEPKLTLEQVTSLWAQKNGIVLITLASELEKLNGHKRVAEGREEEAQKERERSFPGDC